MRYKSEKRGFSSHCRKPPGQTRRLLFWPNSRYFFDMPHSTELPIKTFASANAFEAWLKRHHARQKGVWLRFFKKGSGKQTFIYKDALDAALCYGWIDSLVNRYDAESYIQKFTPRGPRSVWSKVNRAHVERLIKTKKMTAAGLKAVEVAKKDGRWDKAYDSPKNAEVPADFKKLLAKDKKAHAFFKTLNRANLYAIVWRLQTAKKQETRQRRMAQIIAMLHQGKKFH
jgi:uncharacterized protein YdeI (YjbR/CyaY-like superfamily)